MAGLVLEGIVGSGKTSVIRHLKKYFYEKDCSSLILTEHLTERPMEPLSSANPANSVFHLDRLMNVIETLYNTKKSEPKNSFSNPYFVFERFHLSHCLDIAGFEQFNLYYSIDTRLNEHGAKLVVLSVPENAIEERCIVSTRRWRDIKWGNYLNSIAENDAGAAEYYKIQQKRFFTLCQKSEIPSMVVDTSHSDWEEISFQIVEFLNKS